jgi:hypothetical protein
MNPHKITFYFILMLTTTAQIYGQTAADSISMVFPKVLVINDQKQVLLYYDNRRQAYEVPSMGTLDGPISYTSYVDATAKDMGIEYKNLRMGGLFTYIYPIEYSTYIRPYFVIQFDGYTNDTGLSDTLYKWFSYKEAIHEIPYPASSIIVEKILSNPKVVWGATFEEYGYTNPVDRSKIQFNILEDFFKLN